MLYELKVNLNLKVPIHFQKSLESLSKLLASAIMNTSFKDLHLRRGGFKHYVFSNLEEISLNKTYRIGENSFSVRTPNKELAGVISQALLGYEDSFFYIKSIQLKEVHVHYISSLLTLNPCVMSFTHEGRVRNWILYEDGDILFLQNALHNNLVKKYEDFFGQKLETKENFIEFFELKNRKPIVMHYKGGKIFGNKCYIVPKSDEASQKLAFMALADGLGEKNSLGFGFCKGFGRW